MFEVNQFVAGRRAAFAEIETHLASPGGTSTRGIGFVAGEPQHAEIRTFKEGTMGRSAIALGWIVASGITAALVGGRLFAADEHQLHAGDKREVYAAPGADKKSLLNEPLRGVEGQQVTIDHYSLPPAWIGGKHYHTGPVYVYVLEGAFNVDEQGKPRETFKAGEVYPEPIGVPMRTRNMITSDPLRLLIKANH